MSADDDHVTTATETGEITEPFTEKLSLGKTWYGYCAMQGWRPHMEDRHHHMKHLDRERWRHWAYFAIFDGHSGAGAAKNASKYLHRHLLETLNGLIETDLSDSTIKPRHVHSSTKIPSNLIRRAIKRSFVKLDQTLRTMDEDHSGCVCAAALINQRKIFLINVGDARAMIVSDQAKVLASTHGSCLLGFALDGHRRSLVCLDHKPTDPDEQERIYEAGGTITKKPSQRILRVERRLAMTRVLGDFSMNKRVVPPIPDVLVYPRKSSASFIVLGSDCIWDVISNDEAARFISERVQTASLQQTASDLLDHCLAKNSRDNMSVYIVKV